MRVTALALLPILSLPACIVIGAPEGGGALATEAREVGAFTGVATRSSLDVEITEGETASLTLTCDEDLLADIITRVEGDVLVIELDEDGWYNGLWSRGDCRADVVTPTLRSLESSGSGDIYVSGSSPLALESVFVGGSGDTEVWWPVSTTRLDVLSAGSGGVILGQVDAGEVGLEATGSGDLEVAEGAADALDLSASGSGDIQASGLLAVSVDAMLSGSGDAEVYASLSVTALLTGSGDLLVLGSPTERDVQDSGSGDIFFE